MSQHAVSSEPRSAAWFELLLVVASCVILFGPLVVVSSYYARPERLAIHAAVETVGIGVILRAMLRRLIRSGARGVMQTTVGTVVRASSRTMTRRVVRVGVKSLATLLRRTSTSGSDNAGDGNADRDEAPQPTLLALSIGFVALALSLTGVLLVLDLEQPSTAEALGPAAAVLRGMPLLTAVLLGAMPLVVYAALLLAAAPACGARVGFRTGWEALLLQAYFTGSGSYLPLSTDAEISGPQSARTRLALVGLGGLLALHWLLAGAGHFLDSYLLQYLAGMFLLYCFVFSFPIAPLDGYHLWKSSPWLWLAVWIPILVSFLLIMPDSLHVIL